MQARSLAVRALALLIAAALFLATGEVALRILYRDEGRRTLGGPGGRTFDHLTLGSEQLRGRRDLGPRKAGVPRLLVLGDSITYGQGVHDWHDTWPELLASSLERAGHPHELAVFAEPGRDIPRHLQEIERTGPRANADVLIYQWYVNDVEVQPHRPNRTRRWQRWPTHEWLRRHSYLYFFLDNRASELLPPPDRTYADYILQDFRPGTREWAEFERYFHAFSVVASRVTKRRILLLYPQVPYRGRYPLQPLNDAMRQLAGPHVVAIPPAVWLRAGGALETDASAPWQTALRVPAATAGTVVETAEYRLPPGMATIQIHAAAPDLAAASAIARVELVDENGTAVSAHDVVAEGGRRDYQTLELRFTIAGTEPARVRIRVLSSGRAAWSLGSIGIAADYGYEVLDLTEPLNRFDTHASLFDAHPNEAAHRLIAEAVERVLLSPPPVSSR